VRGVFAVKLPVGLEVRREHAVFKDSAQHLDRHRAFVKNGIMKLGVPSMASSSWQNVSNRATWVGEMASL
jgi:hypothetical protein